MFHQASIQQFYNKLETPPRATLISPHPIANDPVGIEIPSANRASTPKAHTNDGPKISELTPGPIRLTITCRVIAVQHRDTANSPSESLKSKGHWKLCVKDDTAALTVLLYYKQRDFRPMLGGLVSIKISHLSHGNSKINVFDCTSLFASIFPERDATCGFAALPDSATLCRRPLQLNCAPFNQQLMALETFALGDHELRDASLLVCVKSVGPKVERTVKDKHSEQRKSFMTEVRVFDKTGETVISLWDALASSPGSWTANNTVLLLCCPGFDPSRRNLKVMSNTCIDVNPDSPEADQLRHWAEERVQKSVMSTMEPPCSTFDVDEALSGQQRLLFNVRMIDEWARATPPGTPIMGYFSLTILELRMCKLRVSRRLCVSQCCNIAIYSNDIIATCKQCGETVRLRLNPCMIGALIDETGVIGCGQLFWSDKAWTELLGRSPDEFVREDGKFLQSLEARMLHMRLTFLLGWESSLKRLSALSVMP